MFMEGEAKKNFGNGYVAVPNHPLEKFSYCEMESWVQLGERLEKC